MGFTLPPALPYEQYGDHMVDPATGLTIPKRPDLNLEWRRKLAHTGRISMKAQAAIRSACAHSPRYFFNGFMWTFLVRRVSEGGKTVSVYGDKSNVPFITWRIQDEALDQIAGAIDGGEDRLIHKSRDMGASWLILGEFLRRWLFTPNSSFLLLSRKEDLVDKRGDMDSLFEKLRYAIRYLPDWMRPKKYVDTKMHLENSMNRSTIDGESTNASAGQGGRKTAIMLDEMARMANAEEIDLSTADTSACRIFNSTHQGPHTYFARLLRSGRISTLEMPFWTHPEKGQGAYFIEDPDTRQKSVTSPYRDAELKRRSRKNVAANIDGDEGQSGDVFFDPQEIEKHRHLYQEDPTAAGKVIYDPDLSVDDVESIIRTFNPAALAWIDVGAPLPWRLWVPLEANNRPNQDTLYVFGVDIAAGTGASNSVITVLDHGSNRVVGKWWHAYTSPEELALVAATSAVWWGGRKPPVICHEKNGPGAIFGKKLHELRYPHIYRSKNIGTSDEQTSKRLGWASTQEKKEILLGMYRDALATGGIINPCRESLDEALDYVYDSKTGKLVPGSASSDEGGARATHGDHVIADALTVEGRAGLPAIKDAPVGPPPRGSFGHRRNQAKAMRRRRDPWGR